MRKPFCAGTYSASQRLALLVDVQNLFFSAKNHFQGKVDYGALLRGVAAGRTMVRAIAYAVQKPDVDPRGFNDALAKLGYELKIKEHKAWSDATSKPSASRVSWDVGITVDAMQIASKVDVVVLATGDGGFSPLVETLKRKGCRVEVAGFERAASTELILAADHFIAIPETWLFRERKMEGAADEGSRSILALTAAGSIAYEGLPREDEIESQE